MKEGAEFSLRGSMPVAALAQVDTMQANMVRTARRKAKAKPKGKTGSSYFNKTAKKSS